MFRSYWDERLVASARRISRDLFLTSTPTFLISIATSLLAKAPLVIALCGVGPPVFALVLGCCPLATFLCDCLIWEKGRGVWVALQAHLLASIPSAICGRFVGVRFDGICRPGYRRCLRPHSHHGWPPRALV